MSVREGEARTMIEHWGLDQLGELLEGRECGAVAASVLGEDDGPAGGGE